MRKKAHLPPQFQRLVAIPLTGELQPITIKWCTFKILLSSVATESQIFKLESVFAKHWLLVLWSLWQAIQKSVTFNSKDIMAIRCRFSHRVPRGKRGEGSNMEL